MEPRRSPPQPPPLVVRYNRRPSLRSLVTAFFHGTGAAATAAGSLYALGSGLGVEALERAGGKVIDLTLKPLTEHVLSPTLQFFFENPALGGIGLAVAVGGFAYSQLKN